MKSRAKIESRESRMPDEEYDVEDDPLVYVFVIITMSNQKNSAGKVVRPWPYWPYR